MGRKATLPVRNRGGVYQIRVPRQGMTSKWVPLVGASKALAYETRAAWLERLERGEKIVFDDLGGESPLRADATIAQIVVEWEKLLDDGTLSPAQKKSNKGNARKYIVPTLGGYRPAELGRRVLRAWMRKLLDHQDFGSASRLRNVYYSACSLIDDAMAEEWIDIAANPFRHPSVKELLPEVEEVEGVPFFELEPLAKLIAAPATPDDRAVRWTLEALQGLDEGEVAALIFDDFQERDGVPVVVVDESLALVGPKGHATAKDPKRRARKKAVPLHALSVRAVRWWREVGWPLYVGKAPTGADPVLPRRKRGAVPKSQAGCGPAGRYEAMPWRPRSAEDLCADLLAAGLPETVCGVKANTHYLRHSFQTHLRRHKVDPAVRDRLMRHAPASVGDKHYDGVSSDWRALHEAVNRIPIVLPRDRFFSNDGGTSGADFGNESSPESSPEEPTGTEASTKTLQSQPLALVAQRIEQRFPKPQVARSNRAGGARGNRPIRAEKGGQKRDRRTVENRGQMVANHGPSVKNCPRGGKVRPVAVVGRATG
jgi:integrase